MDGDLVCPKCKTTKYRNPSLVLMVNVCGHALCEGCVDLLFVTGSGSCPDCGIPLRRANFRVQLFEDSFVDKEVDIRKRILKDFNKRQEDFPSLRDYNDYLEEVETLIFNLVNNIDIINTNKRIEQYKKENKETIQRNRNKVSLEDMELEEILEMEKMSQKDKHKIYENEELEEKKKKLKAKEALIDELMFSDVDAKSIIAAHSQQVVAKVKEEPKPAPKPPTTQFSSGIQIGLRSMQNFLPVPKQEEVPLYKYSPLNVDIMGPVPPSMDRLEEKGYYANIRMASAIDKAGGYTEGLSCYRALQEAMCGLFYIPRSRVSSGEVMDTF